MPSGRVRRPLARSLDAVAGSIELAISRVEGTSGSFTATASLDGTALGVDKMPGRIIGRTLQLTVAAEATAGS